MQNIILNATFVLLFLNLLLTPFVIYRKIKEATESSYNSAILFVICFLLNLFSILMMSRKLF